METAGLVQVEASGEAGIFEWAALTSTGSGALLIWLNANGFVVPPEAGDDLNRYVQQEMHFLAGFFVHSRRLSVVPMVKHREAVDRQPEDALAPVSPARCGRRRPFTM